MWSPTAASARAARSPLSGLTTNTTYHYKVSSVDTYAQSATSPDATFTTTASAPAAISFRAATANDQSGTSTSLVLAVPTGVVNGDALYAVVIYEDGAIPSDPAGWTLVGEAVNPNNNRTRVLRRFAASEPASYRWTFSLGMHVGGAMVAYAGVDPTTPEDATAGTGIGVSTSPTTPSRTTLTSNAWLVSTYGTAGWGLTATTRPAGMSVRASFGGTSSFGFADQLIASPGTTGTRTWSTNAATSWAAVTFALRPAAAGP